MSVVPPLDLAKLEDEVIKSKYEQGQHMQIVQNVLKVHSDISFTYVEGKLHDEATITLGHRDLQKICQAARVLKLCRIRVCCEGHLEIERGHNEAHLSDLSINFAKQRKRKLSQLAAEAVQKELTNQGVPAQRIEVKGLGDEEPPSLNVVCLVVTSVDAMLPEIIQQRISKRKNFATMFQIPAKALQAAVVDEWKSLVDRRKEGGGEMEEIEEDDKDRDTGIKMVSRMDQSGVQASRRRNTKKSQAEGNRERAQRSTRHPSHSPRKEQGTASANKESKQRSSTNCHLNSVSSNSMLKELMDELRDMQLREILETHEDSKSSFSVPTRVMSDSQEPLGQMEAIPKDSSAFHSNSAHTPMYNPQVVSKELSQRDQVDCSSKSSIGLLDRHDGIVAGITAWYYELCSGSTSMNCCSQNSASTMEFSGDVSAALRSGNCGR
eukprot:gnl/MRDRNA2_/MRDRNA2_110979_c0_seq1.p1 gnl/MRDRNA2_/MRDRNA2_110979_c0~~gnl/MRDRNA2_/MRDRNA2_110979_c0_seq1.p1  ORF type:complete len:437 (+),score=80.42 gnl/MRDRNA2_/MRDRNA2_110979_c0_seq1:144-1454(+)